MTWSRTKCLGTGTALMERSEPCRYATACETKTAEYTAPNDKFSLLRRGTIEFQESSLATDQVHELPRNHKL